MLAVRFDREGVLGFIDSHSYLQSNGIEILTPAGTVSVLPYTDVKAICFLRDLEPGMEWRRNRIFAVRPKTEGLWVRFRFRDGDQMDGVVPNNLLSMETAGYTVAPPDPSFQNQRIFMPRMAVEEARVLGVIGTPIRHGKRGKPDRGQIELFEK